MPSSKTPRDARVQLYNAFLTFWQGSAQSEVSIAWDNVDHRTDGAEFVRVQAQHIGGTIAALGNEKYRRELIMTVNIWTPEGAGQRRSDEVGETVLEFFETFSLAGWMIRDPGFNEVGVFDGYYQSAAIATLNYDSLRT